MSFQSRAIDLALARALGEDDPLIAELRGAFIEAAVGHLAKLAEAGGEEEWREAAKRLEGLAASFGAERLLAAARRAGRLPPGETRLAELRDEIERAVI